MIHLKPHHILCSLCFQGKGYSPEFVQNFIDLLERLDKNPLIQITFESDEICSPCPHRRENLCNKQALISKLDHAHAKVLGLKKGEILTWKSCVDLAKKRITIENFYQICDGCGWKDLGICENVIKTIVIHQEA